MLSNKKGQMTNAIYGFLSTFQKLLKDIEPQRVAIAFDLPQPTFRHNIYADYKATRHKMPDELASQMPILKELLCAMGYKLVSLEGFEADDILGTFASYCEKNNYECVLATGDRDILQLVSSNVTVRIASTKFGKSESIFYDLEKVKEEYGVLPKKLVDIKSLQGDTSDNIPGVKGIGQKTAKDLIGKFGSINYIYENIDNIDIKLSVKNKLIDGKENAYLSYKLGEINKEIPLNIDEQDYIPKEMQFDKVKTIMSDLEFFSFMEKMNLSEPKDSEIIKVEILDVSNSERIIENIVNSKLLNFLVTFENTKMDKLFISHLEKIYILDLKPNNSTNILTSLLENKLVEKITYNFKLLHKSLENFNIKNEFDVMLASYLLMPSEKDYDLIRISTIYGIEFPKFEFNNDKLNINNTDLQKIYAISKLKPILESKLKENNQYNLLINIEQPLSKVLADMENRGFEVDKQGLELYEIELAKELEQIESEIYKLSGMEFNINSPKQLGSVLFEKLGLPKGKKGKTGYSTGAQILENLRGYHEVVDLILEYRTLSKLKSTYCDGMIKLITSEGRIHSSFNQTETRTGRISSTEPNLQNIPVRTERGRQLRKFFRAAPEHILIAADYSQIELRVLAHVSDDENMINAFKNDEDIHALTASQILNVPLSMVTPEMRFRAKAVNFGILYGMGAFSLSQDLKISRFDAQNYINRYLSHYQGVDKYMENIIYKAKSQGFVETLFLRRRYLPELNSTNHNLRAFGERVARNMPIQGTAADIIKIAMINVFEKLKNKKSKIILQVHDELIIEASIDETDEIKNLLKYEMENAVKLSVPMKVNVAIGETWFDAKS